jgi:hypothetical protein
VDTDQVAALRALLAPTGWLERTRAFVRSLRQATRTPGGLLLVGTPGEEPWHLTAHLDEESRLAGIPELAPTLVRWTVPDQAPPHLRIGLERLEAARRGETVFVVTPEAAPVPLLERVSDGPAPDQRGGRRAGPGAERGPAGDARLLAVPAGRARAAGPRGAPAGRGERPELVRPGAGQESRLRTMVGRSMM